MNSLRLLSTLSTALRLAWGSLQRNPLRSLLTAFGILIGVAALTVVVALGEGASKAVADRLDALGENALIVSPEQTPKSGVRDETQRALLTEGDAEAVLREAVHIDTVAPMTQTFAQVSWQGNNVSTSVVGSTREFFNIRAYKLASGALWRPSAEVLGEKVCVVGSGLRNELFGGEDPIGRVVRIGRHPFTVIGVLEPKGQAVFGIDLDDVVVMPGATLRAKVQPSRPGAIGSIIVRAKAGRSEQAKRELTALLRQIHGLREGAENDFRIRSQEDVREAQEQIVSVLRLLLVSVAAVSLVIGGIGVMNIMLVSVTERTREIGLRKAVGAQPRDILLQFLIESVVLSGLGGAIGIGFGWLIGFIGSTLVPELPLSVGADAVILATVVSTLIGVGFGIFPANRAARMNPIDALRFE